MTPHRTAVVALALGGAHYALLLLLLSTATGGSYHQAEAFSAVGGQRQRQRHGGGIGTTANPRASVTRSGGTSSTTARWAAARQHRHRRVVTLERDEDEEGVRLFFDPLGEAADLSWDAPARGDKTVVGPRTDGGGTTATTAAAGALALLTAWPTDAVAKALSMPAGKLSGIADFNPDNFKPVCSASDNFYRLLQGTTQAVVGPEAFRDYGPLIAEVFLRIRLELCVVESYFNEAVGPFIDANGFGWVLPWHETVETFLAGTIFSLATTFILVGSTKLISVIVVYGDVLVGGPCRLFGTFFFDRAMGKPVTLDIGFWKFKKRVIGPPEEEIDEVKEFGDLEPAKIPVVLASGTVKYFGEGSKLIREAIEALDVFVGRYLVLIATGYIGFKFLHFKVFPDFPPF